jgi:transposase-like protein
MVRNSLRYVSWKGRKAIALAMRTIYAAPTAEAAEQALEAFAQRWDRRFPSISRSWRENGQRVIPFFAYPPEIRKVISTTDAIESINATLRKVPYLAIQKASEHWARAAGLGRGAEPLHADVRRTSAEPVNGSFTRKSSQSQYRLTRG